MRPSIYKLRSCTDRWVDAHTDSSTSYPNTSDANSNPNNANPNTYLYTSDANAYHYPRTRDADTYPFAGSSVEYFNPNED